MKKVRVFEQEWLQESLDDIFGKPGELNSSEQDTLPDKIKELELHEITHALNLHSWNVAAASRYLGIGRTRLIARMNVLGIVDDSKGQ